MADITKCTGEDCPLKETCYRYTAPNNDFWQSFLVEVPFEDGECEMFYEIK